MRKTVQELRFKVLIEQDDNGLYIASVPEIPGAYTQGKSLEQVRSRIREVIELILEEDPELKKEKLDNPPSKRNFFGVEDLIISSNA